MSTELPDRAREVAPPAADPFERFMGAIHRRDPRALTECLRAHPDLRSQIDRPCFAFGFPAIVEAAARGDREIVEVLLAHGADINVKTDWWPGSFTVLTKVLLRDAALVAFLIEHGATVDVHAAARIGLLDRLEPLVEADPSLVHARGGDGRMPLHFARTIAIADCLLAHGADIDARCFDHESTAAQYMLGDRIDVARHLVSRGCRTDVLMAAALGDGGALGRHLDEHPESIRMCVDPHWFPTRDTRAAGTIYMWVLGQHRTAHQVAAQFGHPDIVALLMARSPADWKLVNACLLGDRATAVATLAGDRDLVAHLPDADLARIAHAARDNHTEAVRLMLECGWPVAAGRPHTPLHWAAFHGNVDMVRALLSRKPPLESIDAEHRMTPLGWAVHGSERGWHAKTGDFAGTVEALLNAGAKVPAPIAGSPPVRALLNAHRPRTLPVLL